MKRILFIVLMVAFVTQVFGEGQTNTTKKPSLESKELDEDGERLDKQILELNEKIAGLISENGLMDNDEIEILPYQHAYKVGSGFIEISKYTLIMDAGRVLGIRKKKIKIYGSGDSVTKIEYEVYEKPDNEGRRSVTYVVDPSPTQGGTDDVQFTYIVNALEREDDKGNIYYTGDKILDEKKLGEVRNNSAFPIRNELKRDFIIQHLTYFHDSLLFIVESYNKSKKDADGAVLDYLKSSTKY